MITRRQRTPTGAAPMPQRVNGIDRVSLGQAVQLTYLGLRNLEPVKKLTALLVVVLLAVAAAAMAVLGDWSTAWLLLAGLLLIPMAVIGGIWINTHPLRGWVVGMFSPTATLLVRQQGACWNLTDHYAWVRGTQSARPFRVRAFAELARQADLLQVVIVTDTRVETLKTYYLDDMPGVQLERTSTTKRGDTLYHLIRHPQMDWKD